ncbi:MAG: hypothetical protein QXO12_01935 [Candidatus Pacearchaeota archaeon]
MRDENITLEKILKNLKFLKTKEEKYSYLENIIEKVNLDHEMKKFLYRIFGKYCLKIGKLEEAFKAYKEANYKKGIIKVGNKYIYLERLDEAFKAYKEVNYKKGIIKVGNKYFEYFRKIKNPIKYNYLNKAFEAYELIKYKKGLIKVGYEYIELFYKTKDSEYLYKAYEVFKLINYEKGRRKAGIEILKNL